MTETTAALIADRAGHRPTVGLVLGSGLGGLVEAVADRVAIPYADLPGFPQPSVSGHAGALVLGTLSGTPVAMLSGRAHYYEEGRPDAMRFALEVLKRIGVETLVLTNSAGSLRADAPPGSVMLITDHINLAGANPLIGEKSDARFVGLTSAYDPELRTLATAAAEAEGLDLASGVYAWFSGPSFETPAEIRMAGILGADAVGMSTVPEVIIARFLGMRVLAFSVITNMAAGITGAELSHEDTKAMAPEGGGKLARLLTRLIGDMR
ncbi:purine-nucleoside phosphorylase [Microbaculum marinum]|uniref:Purine nucleoside phosphorylase n=1 Tax=Microbaculum marinum TaxID=1764581 RepID=A0AAW9RWY0_9HYPH